ncbi:phospholipase A [bacterium]|nr:phospholipase A [bacterium]
MQAANLNDIVSDDNSSSAITEYASETWNIEIEPTSANDNPKRLNTENIFFYAYKDTYIIPFSRTFNDTEDRQQNEIKFQFSIKQPLFQYADFKLNFGYTQKSFWQAYDQEKSSPFRETNYNPELFIEIPELSTSLGQFKGTIGYEHESNGEVVPYSRSWNRLYWGILYTIQGIGINYKMWYRQPEKEKENPDDAEGDDNPDIHEYYGNSELVLSLFIQETLISLMSRMSLSHGKGTVQFSVSHPLPGDSVYGYFQYWNGYGESLIDYNRSLTKVGLGIMIKRSLF